MGRRAGGRWIVAALAAAISGATAFPVASRAVTPEGGRPEAPTACDERSWAGGTTEWCEGALVYRDYVYDDTGADSQPGSAHGTSLSRATGDVDHVAHGQHLNSADLLTLRLRVVRGTVHARFELDTLFPGDKTVAAVAIDTDDRTSTGGGRWGAKLPVDLDVASTGWDEVHLLTARDAAANVVEGTFAVAPGALSSATWRVQAVVALGDGTVMNVAFRPQETGNWWEARQSAALAAKDISAFGARVSVLDLVRGDVHRPAPVPSRTGLYERVYTSAFPVGEGVDYDGVPGRGMSSAGAFAQDYWYLGTHQPYAVYVPPSPADGVFGMQLALHGRSAAHASLVSGAGMQRAFGQALLDRGDRSRLVVVPLGRGPESSYVDWAERDVLDVMADVERHYRVDLDRVFAGGYSMGGYGTFRFIGLHPDLFAGAIVWVGYTGDCLNGTPAAQGRQRPQGAPSLMGNEPGKGCPAGSVGNMFDYLDGARHVPTAMLYSGEDELVWANSAVGLRQRFADMGYEHIWWFHPAAEHLTYAVLDDWRKESAWTAGRVRVSHPARVTYRTNAYLWFAPAAVRQDGAYWVGSLVPANPKDGTPAGDVFVDVVSHACPGLSERSMGLLYGAGVDPLPWVSQELYPVGAAPDLSVPARTITGVVTGATDLTIDVDGACMGAGPITLDLRVDRVLRIHFSDDRPTITVGPASSR